MNKLNKGVILAGGTGSRLYPLNKITNKHLLPVGKKPMIQWNVEKLVDGGIIDILIITGKEHMGDIVSYLGSGSDFGCNFTYKVQDEAGGIAQALQLVEGFIGMDEFFWVILGDNILNFSLPEVVEEKSLVLFTKSVEDPQRFGVYSDGNITEKPEKPKGDKAVLGVYGYKYDTHFKCAIKGLTKSERGEVEVTDLNNKLLSLDFNVTSIIDIGELCWSDAGTLESYQKVNRWEWVWK